VSYTIPEHSLKRDRALRFGRALERAMKRRDVGTRTVAEAIGSGRTAVMYWRTGRMLPRIETARRLAAALDDEGLATLALELRRKRCLVDQVDFIDDSGSDNRVYCSPSCQRLAEKKRIGSTVDKRAAVAERRLDIHRVAVEAYCRGCEPEGRCHDANMPSAAGQSVAAVRWADRDRAGAIPEAESLGRQPRCGCCAPAGDMGPIQPRGAPGHTRDLDQDEYAEMLAAPSFRTRPVRDPS
jgi:transcriptional regulator with XRE-family HTH domain